MPFLVVLRRPQKRGVPSIKGTLMGELATWRRIVSLPGGSGARGGEGGKRFTGRNRPFVVASLAGFPCSLCKAKMEKPNKNETTRDLNSKSMELRNPDPPPKGRGDV